MRTAIENALASLLSRPGLREQFREGCAAMTRELSWDEPVAQMESLYRQCVEDISVTMKPGRIFEAVLEGRQRPVRCLRGAVYRHLLLGILHASLSAWFRRCHRARHSNANRKGRSHLELDGARPRAARCSATWNDNIREPEESLNYASLLKVCGSATNAFVNLANAGGLPARRLLLMSDTARHESRRR